MNLSAPMGQNTVILDSREHHKYIFSSWIHFWLGLQQEMKNKTQYFSSDKRNRLCVLRHHMHDGGNTTMYILSLLLSRTGLIRVQWNPESDHYYHFIYQSCQANGLLCPQEGSRRNSSWLICMFVLHRLNVCYGKSIYYFAAPMTDTTAIFGSVTSHRLDILSWIHLRST